MEAVEPVAGRGRFRALWVVVKILISLGLIGILFWKLNIVSAWERARQLSGSVVISVVLIFVLQTFIAAWRWWVILRHHQVDIRISNAARITFIGAFFNQLLPSSFGGDVARAWYVYKRGYGKGISAITVLSDRIYGMLTLVGLAIVAFPILVHFSVAEHALAVIGLVVAGASIALMTAFCFDRLPERMRRWSAIRHLGSVSAATRSITLDRRSFVPLVSSSVLIHGLTATAILILLDAMTHHFGVLLCLALIPVIMLMAMMPISIAGWGVRESTMIYGLGLAKIAPEAALVASVLVGLGLAAVGIVGGFIWLREGDRHGRQKPMDTKQ